MRKEVSAGKCKSPDVTVLSAHELKRIKHESAVFSKEQLIAQKKIEDEQKQMQFSQALARKKKMLEIEDERRRTAPVLTPMEVEDQDKMSALKKNAEHIHNENRDEVKKMNQLINFAKCATVRDRQLEEKKKLTKEKVDEEKRKDLMMEMERLQAIELAEKKVFEKNEEIRQGRSIIVEQIKEREYLRLKDKEEQAKEAQAMLKLAKQLETEEKLKRLDAKEQVRLKQDEIYLENQNAVEKKQLRYQRERDEEENIIKFNIEKARKEAEYLAEQKRIRDEKEKETVKLRELQEKATNRLAEIDAIKAKRAVEKAERQAREKERREAELLAQK